MTTCYIHTSWYVMKTKLVNTRKAILEEVYENMKIYGFQNCRPDKVVRELDITKGALYHYFPNKLSLGYAVVDEIIKPKYLQFWQPLQDFEGNAIDFLLERIKNIQKIFNENEVLIGSPLSNLIQEMSPVDDGFRKRLESIVNEIQEIIINAIKRSQDKGLISKDLDAKSLTYFYISSIEGSYNLAKVSNKKSIFIDSLICLIDYLKKINNSNIK